MHLFRFLITTFNSNFVVQKQKSISNYEYLNAIDSQVVVEFS